GPWPEARTPRTRWPTLTGRSSSVSSHTSRPGRLSWGLLLHGRRPPLEPAESHWIRGVRGDPPKRGEGPRIRRDLASQPANLLGDSRATWMGRHEINQGPDLGVTISRTPIASVGCGH